MRRPDRIPCSQAALRHRHSRCAPAFTLIEILVVVAIIALLVAVLLPALQKAQHQSRRVKCQANVRQLVTAWHLYLDANAGRFPKGLDITTSFGGKSSILYTQPGRQPPRPLNRHLGLPRNAQKADVFACPADRTPVKDAYGTAQAPSHYDYYGTSYRTNRFLAGPVQVPISALDPCKAVMEDINRRLDDFTRTAAPDEARLVLLGDFGWDDEWNPASTTRIEWHDRAYSHNLGFLDGHADFIPITKGLHVTSRYVVIPFRSLLAETTRCQKPVRNNR